jgi:hypothetical protein
MAAAETGMSSTSVAHAVLGCDWQGGQQQDERRNDPSATHTGIVARFWVLICQILISGS